MDRLSSPEIDQVALIAALEAEAEYERVWLPPEPWWSALTSSKQAIASALHRRLARGGSFPRSQIVDIRKPGHGIRPVSVMSPEVRIIYRALVSALVPPERRVDRSAQAYADFVLRPITSAFDGVGLLHTLLEAKYSHVLVADVAAFYQYIDHAVLRDELDLWGTDLTIIDALLGLLLDIEGRSFGIPQRSMPSDWLSELYIDRVNRWVTRDGFDVWRYSDDFRIGCRTYPEVLRAIESLSRAARDVGLVLNDQKLVAPLFIQYLAQNANVEVDDLSLRIDPSDVEAAVATDYAPEDDVQALAEAEATINRLWDPTVDGTPRLDDRWDLRHLSADEHRQVRRALNTLAREADAQLIPRLLSILAYQPAMTHRVVRYAEAVAPESQDGIDDFLHNAIERLSLNEWQRAWIAFAVSACKVPLAEDSDVTGWLRDQISNRPDSIAAATAVVSLAERGLITFEALESDLRFVSPDFAPWYLHGIALLDRAGHVPQQQLAAVRQTSPIASAILQRT